MSSSEFGFAWRSSPCSTRRRSPATERCVERCHPRGHHDLVAPSPTSRSMRASPNGSAIRCDERPDLKDAAPRRGSRLLEPHGVVARGRPLRMAQTPAGRPLRAVSEPRARGRASAHRRTCGAPRFCTMSETPASTVPAPTTGCELPRHGDPRRCATARRARRRSASRCRRRRGAGCRAANHSDTVSRTTPTARAPPPRR